MDPDDHLADALDRCFGSGPATRPLHEDLAAGRRGLRRRRGLQAVGGALAVVVAASALGLAGGGEPRAVELDPADRSSTPTPTPPAPTDEDVREGGAPVGYDASGDLKAGDGVEVLERISNPLDLEPPATSDAVRIRYGPEQAVEYWLVERDGRGGQGGSSDPVGKAAGTLREWVLWQREARGLVEAVPPVTMAADGTLTPTYRVEILEQRAMVEVGAAFAEPGTTTAAALVRDDGVRRYLLVRRTPGQDPDYLPTSFRVGGPDLDAFLEHARDQYASGEGLR